MRQHNYSHLAGIDLLIIRRHDYGNPSFRRIRLSCDKKMMRLNLKIKEKQTQPMQVDRCETLFDFHQIFAIIGLVGLIRRTTRRK